MPADGLDARSHREILQNIRRTLGCREEEIRDFRPGPSGMMNRAYCFRVGAGEYLYRRPGPAPTRWSTAGTKSSRCFWRKSWGWIPPASI